MIDRDELDDWMRERDLLLIRNSYFAQLTRELAQSRQTATRLYEENDRLRGGLAATDRSRLAALEAVAEAALTVLNRAAQCGEESDVLCTLEATLDAVPAADEDAAWREMVQLDVID